MTTPNGHANGSPVSLLELDNAALEARRDRARALVETQLLESLFYDAQGFGGSDQMERLVRAKNGGDDAMFWVPHNSVQDRKGGQKWPIWRTLAELNSYRQQSRTLVESNTFGACLHKNLVNHIVGKGWTYKAQPRKEIDLDPAKPGRQVSPEQKKLAAVTQRFIDEWMARNRWTSSVDPRWVQQIGQSREREIVGRTPRDGESIIRYHWSDDGMSEVRFIEPVQVDDSEGNAPGQSLGIRHQMEPYEDEEKPVAYYVRYNSTEGRDAAGEWVDADDIVHIKSPYEDSNVKRGTPLYILDLNQALNRASKLQSNLSLASAFRAATAEIWKHQSGTQAQIQAISSALGQTITDPVTGTNRIQERIHSPAVRRLPNGIEPVSMSPLGTSEYQTVVQGDLRQGSAAVCAPEYMTGDASNANYASTREAGTPFMLANTVEQEHYRLAFLVCLWKAIRWAVKCGRLPQEVLDQIEVQCEASKDDTRTELEKAQAAQIWNAMKVKSPQTIQMEMSLDPEHEAQNFEEWEQRFGQQGGGMGGGGMSLDDIMGGMAGGGDQERMESILESHLLEAGFTGVITDSIGRKRHYRDGVQVKGPDDGKPSTRQSRRRAARNRERAIARAHGGIRQAIAGDRTPEHVQKLTGHLMRLTVKQLHQLRRDYQLSASAPLKELLVKKLADRLIRGRSEDLINGPGQLDVGGIDGLGNLPPSPPAGQRIVTARAEKTRRIDPEAVPRDLRQHLTPEQVQGVGLGDAAIQSHGFFLLADSTGVGKTRTNLALAKMAAARGKKVLYVSTAAILKPEWSKGAFADNSTVAKDSRTMGVPIALNSGAKPLAPGQIHLTTYQQVGQFADKVDADTIVIFDEAHYIKGADSKMGRDGRQLASQAGGTVYSTATPADVPEDMAYVYRDKFNDGRSWKDRAKDFSVKKHGAEGVLRNMDTMFEQLTEQGVMIRREISLDNLDIAFDHIEMPAEVHDDLDRLAGSIGQDSKNAATAVMAARIRMEHHKIPYAAKVAKEELAAGRRPIIFLSTVNAPEGSAPGTKGSVESLRDELERIGIPRDKVVEYHGDTADKDAIDRFQSGDASVFVTTIPSGSTGINLNDTKGDAPRTCVVVTPPWTATEFGQIPGRALRMNTVGKAKLRCLFADTKSDQHNYRLLSQKIANMQSIVGGEIDRITPKPHPRKPVWQSEPRDIPMPSAASMESLDESDMMPYLEAVADILGGIYGEDAVELLDHVGLQESVEDDPDLIALLESGAGGTSWVAFTGPRGGKGWKNSKTGRVVYGAKNPGGSGAKDAESRPVAPKVSPKPQFDPRVDQTMADVMRSLGARKKSRDAVASVRAGQDAFSAAMTPSDQGMGTGIMDAAIGAPISAGQAIAGMIGDEPVHEVDKWTEPAKRAAMRHHVDQAKVHLSSLSLDADLWKTDLRHDAAAKQSAISDPVRFDRTLTHIEDSLRQAAHFGVAADVVHRKIEQIRGLRADVAAFRAKWQPEAVTDEDLEVMDPQIVPDHYRKRGAGKINTQTATEHLEKHGDAKGAVAHLMKVAGLAESTAKRYVRAAVKQLAAKSIPAPSAAQVT